MPPGGGAMPPSGGGGWRTCDLIEAVWARRPPYKLLDCGSANGLTLKAFAKMKVDAWGVENNEYIHSQTPKKWLSRNLKGDVKASRPASDNSNVFERPERGTRRRPNQDTLTRSKVQPAWGRKGGEV